MLLFRWLLFRWHQNWRFWFWCFVGLKITQKRAYKTLIGANLLHIRFNELDGFIRVYDGNRCLALFGGGKLDFIYNRAVLSCRNKK